MNRPAYYDRHHGPRDKYEAYAALTAFVGAVLMIVLAITGVL